MKVKDLKPNKRNPRKITNAKLKALQQSLAKFGDLSGFVFNRRTKSLISGHQRTKTIPEDSKIIIEIKHDKPTKAFTVAEGYILIGDERFKYREVDAPESWEVEALLAANKQGGEWDRDILKLNFSDFPDMDLEMTGFDIPELKIMDIEFKPTIMMEETDEQYVKNTQTVEEPIDIERPPNDTKYENKPAEDPSEVFDKIDEEKSIVGKRFIIIIDCKDDGHKKEIKEKLQEQVHELGGKFF
jgi:hypothetical protein